MIAVTSLPTCTVRRLVHCSILRPADQVDRRDLVPGTAGTFGMRRRLRHATPEAIMRSTLLNGDSGNRTFAVIMETGDEAMSCLQTFVEKERISAAQFTAIGALSDARLSYFD